MEIAQTALRDLDVMPWWADWACGVPLIALNMVVHAIGLLLISQSADRLTDKIAKRCRYHVTFVVITGSTAMLAVALHGIEGAIWAVSYLLLGAVPNYHEAVLYSLGAMTTYGHVSLFLQSPWPFLGALEALDGMLLFGLTTAFLFGIIQNVRKYEMALRATGPHVENGSDFQRAAGLLVGRAARHPESSD